MNIYMFWPIFLAVFADVFYQICSKSTPATLNPFAGLTITYLVGAAITMVIFFYNQRRTEPADRMEINQLDNLCSWFCDCRPGGWKHLHVQSRMEYQYRVHCQIHNTGNGTDSCRILHLQGAVHNEQGNRHSRMHAGTVFHK